MTTVLLALGDPILRDAVRAQLDAAGHATILLGRPLASLTLASKVVWDAVLLDDSGFGRDALASMTTPHFDPGAIIGLGFEDPSLAASIPLPLVQKRLLAVVDGLTSAPVATNGALSLDGATRLARANGRQVALTRTECRLLQVLEAHRPNEVSLVTLLESVWGFSEGRSTSELVRAHVRNLRAKLAGLGLTDAVRSRRGSGYALVV